MRKAAALASLAAALCAAEAEADDYSRREDNSAIISLAAGWQDNDLNNGYDFTEGLLARMDGYSAVTFYDDAQFILRGSLELGSLRYSGGGNNLVLDAEFSQLYEWAPRWETFGLNLGAGLDSDCLHEAGSYDSVPLASTICSAGPALDFAIDSEYVYFGLGYSIGFGIMGNNVQGYNDLIKHKLNVMLGFHIASLDITGFTEGEYNTAMQGQINRENVFIWAGANGRLWLDENFALQFMYRHAWAFGDIDERESDSFVMGLAARF